MLLTVFFINIFLYFLLSSLLYLYQLQVSKSVLIQFKGKRTHVLISAKMSN